MDLNQIRDNSQQNCGRNRQSITLQNIIDILTKNHLDIYRLYISDIYRVIYIKATMATGLASALLVEAFQN